MGKLCVAANPVFHPLRVLVAPRMCELQVVLATPGVLGKVDRLEVVDDAGEPVRVLESFGSFLMDGRSSRIVEGRSGVLMVEALAQTAGLAAMADPTFAGKLALFGGIDKARFRRQVIPGDVLTLEATLGRMGARAGKGSGLAHVDGETACQADMLFVIVDAAP